MWIAVVNLFRVTFIVVMVVDYSYDCCCFHDDGGCQSIIMALTSFVLQGRFRYQPTVLLCFFLFIMVFPIVCVVDVVLVLVVILITCFAPSSTTVL